MNNSLSGQIEQHIYQVLLPLEQSKVEINPSIVASEVDKLIDPESVSPELKTFASMEQIKNQTRKLLAKRHDPVEKAKDYVADEIGDLFAESLQPYYPVKRVIEKKKEAFYIPREQLTETDVHAIAKRMSKAGDSLLEHARALQAWHISRAA